MGSTPSTKRSWPTRSVWRYSWYSKRSLPPSDSRSCCTTCSRCLLRRSLPSWGAPRAQQGSWRAVPAGGFRAKRTFLTPTSPPSERASTPSLLPPPTETSTRCSRCARRGRADAHLLRALPVRTTGAREWGGGRRRGPAWTALFGHGLHDQRRKDRGDRHPSRPCAPEPARRVGLRRLMLGASVTPREARKSGEYPPSADLGTVRSYTSVGPGLYVLLRVPLWRSPTS